MNVVYEDAGKLQVARVVSEADASLQVESASGKRSKIKRAQALLTAASGLSEESMAQAKTQSQAVDLALVWELAPDDGFGFESVASDYFGASASVADKLTALLALHDAPHYFRRLGKGQYKKADAKTLAAALAAIEKKAQVQASIDAWAAELAQGRCPDEVRAQVYKILFKPDKNSPEFKAVVAAAKRAAKPALTLLCDCGAVESAYALHWQRFVFEHFAQGTAFSVAVDASEPQALADVPVSDIDAFSIDDSATTEIDDALSVRGLGTGTVHVGIHIAAPSLGLAVGGPVDAVARTRLSTVYMPGHKIPMLPSAWIDAFSLNEGRCMTVVSLHLVLDEATLALQSHSSCIEQVRIAANLRHDQLGQLVTPDWLSGGPQAEGVPPSASVDQAQRLRPELAFLHRFALVQKAQREAVRGKPESFNRPDFQFSVDADGAALRGNEPVRIQTRPRGEPLDLIVAECMIVANHHWGQMLADRGIPGIYRSQHSLAPGMKVRMGTKALPHAGIGVPCYAWSTSPLRRYTDMVNQWQIASAITHGATAALHAPFKPKDASLLAVIGAFEAAYSSYAQFQNGMERYWTLQHIQQQGLQTLECTVVKDIGGALLRCDALPLVFGVAASHLQRGQRVKVRVQGIDLFGLELHAQVLEVLQSQDSATSSAEEAEDDDSPPAAFALPDLALDADDTAVNASAESPPTAAA